MTVNRFDSIAVLAEIAEVLSRHGQLRCAPRLDDDDGLFTLSVTFQAATANEGLEILSLADELRYVTDVSQMRAFSQRYGINSADLEALIGQRRDEQ